MIGIYFSGTGNTKHCVERLLKGLDENAQSYSIESMNITDEIAKNDFIVFGYPTQYSNVPVMVRDYINKNASVWKDKKVLCVVTMGTFCGDGAGCLARLLKKHGANVVGGLHLCMPNSSCDVKARIRPFEKNKQLIKDADAKIDSAITKIKNGKYPKDGLSIFNCMAGLFAQRLWFSGMTKNYSDKIKISDACVGCGLCEKNCPMNNIIIENGKAKTNGRCTMCYRCLNSCPKQAVTLLGDKVIEQISCEKFK